MHFYFNLIFNHQYRSYKFLLTKGNGPTDRLEYDFFLRLLHYMLREFDMNRCNQIVLKCLTNSSY